MKYSLRHLFTTPAGYRGRVRIRLRCGMQTASLRNDWLDRERRASSPAIVPWTRQELTWATFHGKSVHFIPALDKVTASPLLSQAQKTRAPSAL